MLKNIISLLLIVSGIAAFAAFSAHAFNINDGSWAFGGFAICGVFCFFGLIATKAIE